MPTPSHLFAPNEGQRLAALQAYQVAGDAPFFDEFVRLTGKLFQVPIALVSLVESDTVWFRGNSGLEGVPERVPRDESLCSVAVLSDETTMFMDLADRPCTLIDPTAVGALGLRFYAGFPLLTTAGEAVGTLCVIDRQPRFLEPEEAVLLRELADVALLLLELQAALTATAAPAPALWPTIYVAIADSISRLDTLAELRKWEETADTPAALNYQAARREEASMVAKTLQKQIQAAIQHLKLQF
ncbi:GAF domain-containing protein [Hymenobacter sp. B1770]|uniref:GAF domain-containing protein n=1 Tax=Hymenobacter sp. B1770 TaxID=1718788 RepID=UPI003CEEFEF3